VGNKVKRIILKYKGPKHTRFRDYLTDGSKLALYLFFPYIFKLIDSEGYEAEL